MVTIKIGDIVTWRHGKSTATNVMPIGIADCVVLEFGVSPDGRPAARLKLPPLFDGLHADACNAYVDDLEPAEENKSA